MCSRANWATETARLAAKLGGRAPQHAPQQAAAAGQTGRCAAAGSPQMHILVMQRGKGNRADLGSDLEEALRLLYPNPCGSAYVGFKPAS